VWIGREEIAEGYSENLAQPAKVFGRDTLRRAFVGFNLARIDPERPGEEVFAQTQCAAFAPDSSADMLINRGHAARPRQTSFSRY
jgi:hypothetical protein